MSSDTSSVTLVQEIDANKQTGSLIYTPICFFGGIPTTSELKRQMLAGDIGMPFEDGYTLLSRIRAVTSERGGRIPAIALTALARPEDRRRALQAGYQVHLTKPVDAAELAAVVANLASPGTEVST